MKTFDLFQNILKECFRQIYHLVTKPVKKKQIRMTHLTLQRQFRKRVKHTQTIRQQFSIICVVLISLLLTLNISHTLL